MSRRVTYTDDAGRRWVVVLPDDKPISDAAMGIPVGPPSMEPLGLPEEIEVRLHNALVDRGLLTERDFKTRRSHVMGALQTALKVDIVRVAALYAAAKGGDDVRVRPRKPAKPKVTPRGRTRR